MTAMVMVATRVAEETFGQYLKRLRGKERLADVQRRMGGRITAQYLGTLEERSKPGAIKTPTLWVLAEAYAEHYHDNVEEAFWDLWRRAGYPLPPGYAELNPETRRLVVVYLAVDEAQRARIREMLAKAKEDAERGEEPPND